MPRQRAAEAGVVSIFFGPYMIFWSLHEMQVPAPHARTKKIGTEFQRRPGSFRGRARRVPGPLPALPATPGVTAAGGSGVRGSSAPEQTLSEDRLKA